MTAVREARKTVGDMRAGTLGEGPLSERLAALIETKRDRNPDVDFELSFGGSNPGCSISESLFPIAGECLRNTVRHSGATKASLSLACRNESIVLIASDNGRGFSADEVLEQEGHVDCLMDLRLSGEIDGLEAISQICGKWMRASIIVLTTYACDENIHRALDAGAKGYLIKDALNDDLLKAIAAVRNGRLYFPPSWPSALLSVRLSSR